ncbi:translation factor GTPase family protein [uncultured Clostridium sp.]|uniref:elongation factor G n=1 Tax=uncultured Clostridium sp. TaxID=59620 RepID=UPI0025FE6B25|nr:TetM/TetW/TetO/TetS family tetracycline resistance ribosomal protection protein [uncultured Clostridium sp.]
MKKTIGVLAHVDAGKTTFSEHILFHTNSIRKCGRVDHKDTFLDSHDIERERGITIFSDQGIFKFNDSTYYLVDTPGHVDFSTEMERSIMIMDYAVIIISAAEGVQGHTKTVWNLLRKYNIPTFFFINKLDRVGADKNRVISEIKNELTKNVCPVDVAMSRSVGSINFSDELIEFISEQDDKLLERYFAGNYDEELWKYKLKELIKKCIIFPCFGGCALQDEGIIEFLYGFDELTFTSYDDCKNDSFIGKVYKVRHDDNGNRITFMKCIQGTLNVRDEVIYGQNEDEALTEKISSIRIYNGTKFKTCDRVEAGDVFGVSGISKASAFDTIGEIKEKSTGEMVPTLMSKVIFDKSYNIKEVLGYFKILESEDPSLNVIWNESLQELHVNVMGKIQLEVLKEIVSDRFNICVEFGPCEILYKETIKDETIGCGHFEPLRHYAEVIMKIEPSERNSGISFESSCHVDDLSINFQKLIRSHIFEREHHGLLTGSPVTDIKITLLNGRSHLKHTCGGDFREAAYRALRQGLEKVENILLEPYYRFVIEASSEYTGRILTDIQRLYGSFEDPVTSEDKVIIKGRGPVSTFMDYSMEVAAFTRGRGSISLMFDGYDKCHNSEEVIERRNYNKNADIEYTSNSVFCSHGSGYIVDWKDADEKMHCFR